MEKNVLLAVTGSVAAIKVPELVQRMLECSDIKVSLPEEGTLPHSHYRKLVLMKVKCSFSEYHATRLEKEVPNCCLKCQLIVS